MSIENRYCTCARPDCIQCAARTLPWHLGPAFVAPTKPAEGAEEVPHDVALIRSQQDGFTRGFRAAQEEMLSRIVELNRCGPKEKFSEKDFERIRRFIRDL